MIELPEASVIATQITRELRGKTIRRGTRGNSPHKFAFYSGSPEEYGSILAGKTMGSAGTNGSFILVDAEPDYVLGLGCGGERILLHESFATVPKKHHLLLEFADGTCLSVSIQGWGAALLIPSSEVAAHPFIRPDAITPVSDAFTYGHFQSLFDSIGENDACSVKFFSISKPGILGVGNGYLQDILFRAKIHPRRRVASLGESERRALYDAVRYTLTEAIRLGGRDSERDLHNNPGGYSRLLDSKMVGRPCPDCSAAIEKISFLGGACYFCPECQV